MFAGKFIPLLRAKKKEAGAVEWGFIACTLLGAFLGFIVGVTLSYFIFVGISRATKFIWEILAIGALLGGICGSLYRYLELRSENQQIKYYQEHIDLRFE